MRQEAWVVQVSKGRDWRSLVVQMKVAAFLLYKQAVASIRGNDNGE